MPPIVHTIVDIWLAGGWLMIPLLALCLAIFATAARLWSYFSRRDFHRLDEQVWRDWVRNPAQADGEVGEIIRYTQDDVTRISDIQNRFSEVVTSRLPEVNRRLVFMNVMVAAAPLLGLLGTVLGMIFTFNAISLGGGKLTEMMAQGIAQALITTEMGLLIAIPGYFLTHVIQRKKHEFEAFLSKLESATIREFESRKEFAA